MQKQNFFMTGFPSLRNTLSGQKRSIFAQRKLRSVFAKRKLQNSRIFLFLTRIPFLRNTLSERKRIYQSICPYEDKKAEEMALSSLAAGVAAYCILFLTSLFFGILFCGPSVYTFLCPFFAGYYGFIEALLFRQNRVEEQLQTELSSYFLNVSHYYQSEHSILNALSKGASMLSEDIQAVSRFVTEILTSEDAETLIYAYVTDADKNLYLKLFLQQCYECFERGDTVHNGVSVFCETLETFRIDMLRTKMERQRNNAKLQGLSFVLWFPALFLGYIRKFGLSLRAEMVVFYAKYGLFIECGTLAAALLLYQSLNRTKFRHLKIAAIHDIYYRLQEFTGWFQDAKPNWLIKRLKKLACNVPPAVCYTKLLTDTLLGVFAGFLLILTTTVQNHTMLRLPQLLPALAFGGISLFFPLKVLLLEAQFKKDKEYELDSIQLLMLSEMHSKTITLADLLAKMERLASYYRSAIGECLNVLSYDRTKALSGLRQTAEKERDITLCSIVDMLVSVDRLGIEKAFSELKVNRQLSIEERHMLRDISAERKKDLHEITSLIPAAIAIGLYIVIPFVYYTWVDLEAVTGSLETMGGLF